MRVNLNPFTVETWGRVYGTTTFITAVDIAIPQAQLHTEDALGVFADEQKLDDSEYSNERDMLEEQYRYWVARFATYAGVILLHSTVETQMFACADWVRSANRASLTKKPKRRMLERARRYLQEVSGFNAATDEAWSDLLRLEELRGLIVHRGGNVGDVEVDRKLAERLRAAYPGKLWVLERSDLHVAYVAVSPVFCTEFGNLVEGFFRRLLGCVAELDSCR